VVAGWQADRTAVATADGALRAVAVDGKTPTTNAGQSSCPSTKSKPIKQATTECSGRKHRNLVKQEIWSLLLTHYAIRHVMKDAADTVGTDPDDLSFIRSYRAIRRQVPNQAGFSP
jgi:hypothetical protein